MRIGIFGGTFNPIHFGHLVLAEQAYEKLNLDKVIFIPSCKPPHKRVKDLASAEDRYNMVSLAIQNNKRFEISDIEIKRKGKSYLVDTLKEIHSKYPKSELFFISGSDVTNQIHKWKSIEEILKLVNFVIAKRPGYRLKRFNKNVTTLSVSELDISSSNIRRKIKNHKTVLYIMPIRVFDYIKKKGLYQ